MAPQRARAAPDDSGPPEPYDPRAYSLWVRGVQAKLLEAQIEAQSDSAETVLAAEQNAEAANAELTQAFAEMEEHVALRPAQWGLYSTHALSLLSHQQRGDSTTIASPTQLADVIRIHDRAAQAGTGMDAAAHARLFSLLLHWHSSYTGVDVWALFNGSTSIAPDAVMLDSDPVTSKEAPATVDILHEQTGIVGGPILQATSSGAWTYVAPSLPVVLSQAEVATRVMELGSGDDILVAYETLLNEASVRERLWSAYACIAHDVVNSQAIFLMYLSFEMAYLRARGDTEQRDRVLHLFKARMAVTHEQHSDTMSMMSEFVTSFFEPEQYESLMASAAAAGAAAEAGSHAERVRAQEEASQVRSYEEVTRPLFVACAMPRGAEEPSDEGRAQLAQYLGTVTDRPKVNADQAIILFRRILALTGLPPTLTRAEQAPPSPEYETSRGAKNPGTKTAAWTEQETAFAAAEGAWEDYLSFHATHSEHHSASAAEELDKYTQALRALPGSGSLWALLLRTQTRLWQPAAVVEETFQTALSRGQVAKRGAAPFAALLLGRCVAEKQFALTELAQVQEVSVSAVQLGEAMDTFLRVEEVVVRALDLAKTRRWRKGSSGGKAGTDPELRVERFFSGWCERFGSETALLAIDMWREVANAQRTSCRAQVTAAEYFTRVGLLNEGRHIYKRGSRIVSDDRTRLLDAWVAFEQVNGTVSDLEYALARCKRETQKVWEQYYASYQAQAQAQAQAQNQAEPQSYEVAPAPAPAGPSQHEPAEASQLDKVSPSAALRVPTGNKRTADEAALGQPSAVTKSMPAPLQTSVGEAVRARPQPKGTDLTHTPDRENTAVVVSSGKPEAPPSPDELQTLFLGCGTVRDVLGPRALASGNWGGMVVFADRSAVPAAMTRNKKRIMGAGGTTATAEVEVTVARDCTLFVKNFPETFTDTDIKALFAEHGDILDTRWPSMRYNPNRRFCYVEMATAEGATRSLSLDQREFCGLKLSVKRSDPERREERSDANATEREVYVTRIPHEMSVPEIHGLFAQYGDLLAVRVPRPGVAFADFRTSLDAHKAIAQLNGLHVRANAAPLKASPAEEGKKHKQTPRGGQGFRSRAVHVAGLPADAQEALVKQTFERLLGLGTVRKVEYTIGASTAIVELAGPQVAGKALLASGVQYEDRPLVLTSLEQGRPSKPSGRPTVAATRAAPPQSATAFAPRAVRPRAQAPQALQAPQAPQTHQSPAPASAQTLGRAEGESMDVDATPAAAPPAATPARKPNQDKFRALLG